ncbi:MAG: gamma-glutamyltransferase [Blastocatellia bacterium]|nr:gamma-glutamyltransferase [Blastocatellia bacterium]
MPTLKLRRIICSWTIVVIFFATLSPLSGHAATREPVRAKNGMVASQHVLASQIGVDIMKKGGNAVDAAIAVGIALAVVYPEAGNIGGGGFMVIRKRDGSTHAIDYREMAPAAAHRDLYVDSEGNIIRGEGGSTVGYRASGVPGTLAGFDLAHKKYGSGTIAWKDLVEPARKLAEDGYVLSHRLSNLFIAYKDTLSKYPESNRIFLRDGDYFKEGDTLKQPELAQTLERVRDNGAAEFYTGKTAEMIAADMKANNGLITMADLKNYVAKERDPIRGRYRGHEIISMPPPSSGGIVMMQVLKMLEQHDIRAMQHNSAAKYHLYTEASRRAFADRAEYMADPDFADVPIANLMNETYVNARRATIDMKKATPSTAVKFGEFAAAKEGTETTHYTVVDADGTMVSNTYTINDLYGSRVTIKGTGILMNDEMDDFAARPGTPNLFGLVQGERNKVEGGKRPLSSMTPTIVLRKDGSVWFAVGARGGPRIISAVIQTVINVIDHEMNIQQAIDAPRIHHQWLPDEIMYEMYGMSPDTMNILTGMGHKFVARPGNIAQATGIMVAEDGTKLGAIDGRGDGEAVGY